MAVRPVSLYTSMWPLDQFHYTRRSGRQTSFVICVDVVVTPVSLPTYKNRKNSQSAIPRERIMSSLLCIISQYKLQKETILTISTTNRHYAYLQQHSYRFFLVVFLNTFAHPSFCEPVWPIGKGPRFESASALLPF